MAKEIREAGYEPLPGDSDPTTCPNLTNYPLYTSAGVTTCYKFVPITGQSATGLTLQFNWNGSTCTTPCSPISTGALVTDPMNCPTAACRGEQVTYSLSGGNLRRQEVVVDASPVIIASGITALTFTYRDELGAVTTALDSIRTVDISITAQTANKGAYVTMVDRIRLRNR
jgi:hypothetical protein